MWPYSDTENAWLRDSHLPHDPSDSASWSTVADVEFHRRNAEIMRSEAVFGVTLSMFAGIRHAWRKLVGLPSKFRTQTGSPSAHA